MPQRELNNAAVENVLWEACQRLRNDEVGKKLWSFMKRTWLSALSELKRDPEAPSSPEDRRARFAKAFISDTLWRLYQSAESGVLEISSEDAEFLFGQVLCRPRIFPEEAGGNLPPPPKPWKLIVDVVEDTFLEVTDAKDKDHNGAAKTPKKRKQPSRKPPGKMSGRPTRPRPSSASTQDDVPFWYRKLMGMEDQAPPERSRQPRSPPRPGPGPYPAPFARRPFNRSPERWDPQGSSSWPRWPQPSRLGPPGAPSQRSRSPRGGPTNALARHVHIPPLRTQSTQSRPPGTWRSGASGSRRARRGGHRERRRTGRSRDRRRERGAHTERRGRRRSPRRETSAPALRRSARKRSREVTMARGRGDSPGGLSRRVKSERRGRSSARETSKQPEGPEASGASSACSSPRAGKASKAASATKEESPADEAAEPEAEEEGKSSCSTSAEESQEEKEERKETASPVDEEQKEQEEEEDAEEPPSGGILLTEAKAEAEEDEEEEEEADDAEGGGICLTEAKDVRRTPEEDMFDDLDDVGLMAQLQGRLKEEAADAAQGPDGPGTEADHDGAAGAHDGAVTATATASGEYDGDANGDAKDAAFGQALEVCANVAKGICLSKEAPRQCKTPFDVAERGGIFAGAFCQSCSEILVCGWGEDRKNLDL